MSLFYPFAFWDTTEDYGTDLFGHQRRGGHKGRPPVAGHDSHLVPRADVVDSSDGKTQIIAIELPGCHPDKDLDIEVHGSKLIVQGKINSDTHPEGSTIRVSERVFGPFMRAFQVTPGLHASEVTAKFTDGVLKLTLPKHPKEPTAERVRLA